MPPADPVFEEHRAELERLAYRMLGSLADADDVLQDAYLRWTREDRAAVRCPRAYLSSVVTRLCIDQRRAIEARKESYVGPWLPEPVVESPASAPGERLGVAEEVSLALLVVLESLSPFERAAYLLRRIFDYGYEEIGEILDRSEAACRQLVSRAEEHVRQRRPRFEADRDEAERITGAFLQACSTGDLDALVRLLAADAVHYSDGGGKVPAALAPIRGADRIARLFVSLTQKAPPGTEYRQVLVNGQPGVMSLYQGQVDTVVTFDIAEGRIAACFAVRNPEKLARVGDGGPAAS